MKPLPALLDLLEMGSIDPGDADPGAMRDRIKGAIAERLAERKTALWLAVPEPAGIWCAPVAGWTELTAGEAWSAAGLEQRFDNGAGNQMRTTRCPIRFGGTVLSDQGSAPPLGGSGSVAETMSTLDGSVPSATKG